MNEATITGSLFCPKTVHSPASNSLRLWAALLLFGLVACSPTFNWRLARTHPAPLQVLMPCKPERAERRVPMTAEGVDLQLMRCETGGLTFVWSWARLNPGDDRAEVLLRWHRASLVSWQAAETDLLAPPGGASPRLRQVWQGTGRNHRGEPLALRSAYFVDGDWVYQALLMGPVRNEDVATTFLTSLQ